MANHCVEVICALCGAMWCVRGCNYEEGPSQGALDKFLGDCAYWRARHNKPDGKPVSVTETCKHCEHKVAYVR